MPPARQAVCQLPADKGSGAVVMEKTWYIDECNRQLTETNSTDALTKTLLPTYKNVSPFTLQDAQGQTHNTTKPDNTIYMHINDKKLEKKKQIR